MRKQVVLMSVLTMLADINNMDLPSFAFRISVCMSRNEVYKRSEYSEPGK